MLKNKLKNTTKSNLESIATIYNKSLPTKPPKGGNPAIENIATIKYCKFLVL